MLREVSFQSCSPFLAIDVAADTSKTALEGRIKSDALILVAAHGLQASAAHGLQGLQAFAAHGLHGLQALAAHGLQGLQTLAAHGLQGLQGLQAAANSFFRAVGLASTTLVLLLSQPASARPVAAIPPTIARYSGFRRLRFFGS